MISWDMQWGTIRAASRVSIEGRDRVMREMHGYGLLTVSDIANAARLSMTQTHRILARRSD